jgi:hypothetical protein
MLSINIRVSDPTRSARIEKPDRLYVSLLVTPVRNGTHRLSGLRTGPWGLESSRMRARSSHYRWLYPMVATSLGEAGKSVVRLYTLYNMLVCGTDMSADHDPEGLRSSRGGLSAVVGQHKQATWETDQVTLGR